MLSDDQLMRYNRQLLVPDFDIAGQEALHQATVMVLGLGGLGCPAALYLAAAGVGRLLLVDGDEVELSNLQRQVAHGDADIGRNKAASVAGTIAGLNPEVETVVHPAELRAGAIQPMLADVQLVVDASDNYPTRFELNRACIAAGIPMVSAAAVRDEGQLAVFDPHRGGPCYRCLYPSEGEHSALSCSQSGVLAPVVGVLGSLQAMEALKLLADYGAALRGAVLMLDLRNMQIQQLRISPRPECPDCCHLQPGQ